MTSSVAFPKILTLKLDLHRSWLARPSCRWPSQDRCCGSVLVSEDRLRLRWWLRGHNRLRRRPRLLRRGCGLGSDFRRFGFLPLHLCFKRCACGCRGPASCEAGPSSWLRLPAGAAAPLDCCRHSNPFANNRLTATARKPIPMPGRRPTRWTLARGAHESKQMCSDQAVRMQRPTTYDMLLLSRFQFTAIPLIGKFRHAL